MKIFTTLALATFAGVVGYAQPADATDLGVCYVEDVNGAMIVVDHPDYTLGVAEFTVGTGTTEYGFQLCQPTACPDTHVMVSATCWPVEQDPFANIPIVDEPEPEAYTGGHNINSPSSVDVGPLVEPAIPTI